MTPHSADALRLLVMRGDVSDSTQVAKRVVALSHELSKHLGRLVGDLGIRALLERSIYLASSSSPCLANAPAAETPYDTLRMCLEKEQPELAVEAGFTTLRMFIELLERFIGERLVATLLHEVWPASFPSALPKETK